MSDYKHFWLVKLSTDNKSLFSYCYHVDVRFSQDSGRPLVERFIPGFSAVRLEDAPDYVMDAISVLDVVGAYQYIPGVGEQRRIGYLVEMKDE